jgi:hypothetical protein|tara:strand:+ start:3327 stop:3671 length:345 start_codon:yes stop_codon:yes gene_type:complete
VAAEYNIAIDKGIHFDVTFTLKDASLVVIDVTNYTFRAEIKRRAETGLIKAFTVTKTDAVNGVIELEMLGADTLALPVGVLAWDLVAEDNANKIRRYLYGDVTVTESVSDTVFP